MEVHRPDNAPDHVHDCPECEPPYDGGAACIWKNHSDAYKAKHKDKYEKAKG